MFLPLLALLAGCGSSSANEPDGSGGTGSSASGSGGAAAPNDDAGSGSNSANDTCAPLCDARECGDDTCGGSCGACADGATCDQAAGTCALPPPDALDQAQGVTLGDISVDQGIRIPLRVDGEVIASANRNAPTDGDIEAYGWDIFSEGDIYSPGNSTDYMGYCSNWWASQYGWNLMEPWIAEVSRWRDEAQ